MHIILYNLWIYGISGLSNLILDTHIACLQQTVLKTYVIH